jgi:spermidine synthase
VSLVILIGFGFLDTPSQRAYWSPYKMVASADSRYGKLQMIQTQEQFSLYSNSALVYTYPDPAAAEEAVHFALLQLPLAQRVLLIGGGAGGAIAEILKYPRTEVDYVELDPEIIRFTEDYLPDSETRALKNTRVNIHFTDGRTFLSRINTPYDVVILNLPDPNTAQINRFYTLEFFRLVQSKISDHGIFSMRVTSSENYISPELQEYLSTLFATLKAVFPAVRIVPGGNNIFLASRELSRLETTYLIDKIAQYKLDNTYVSPQILPTRPHPFRIAELAEKIKTGPSALNLDLQPISYYFNALIWSTQFHELESRIVKFFSRLDQRWLLGLPLLLFFLCLISLGSKGPKTVFFLIPLVLLGFTAITAEILAIFAFQITQGYLYQSLALLFSAFMLGLFLGALRGLKRARADTRHLILLQALFLCLLLCLWLLLTNPAATALFYIFLFLLGFLSGDLFVLANSLFLRYQKNYGLGYGLDLLGGFLGALGTSSILVPLMGIPTILAYLGLANILGFGFLIWGRSR